MVPSPEPVPAIINVSSDWTETGIAKIEATSKEMVRHKTKQRGFIGGFPSFKYSYFRTGI
jgi:hypothetical protein